MLANRLVYSGRSQGDLARFLDVSQPTVSRLVKGQAPVSRFRAERLAEFLGGKPDDYMTAEADEGGMSVEIPLDTYMGYLIRAVILTGHPGTTLKDVADSVGMTQRELAGWARGDFEVSESIAQRLLMRWLPGWAS